ncbi:hypothetical protein [Nostoc sp.]|uniref:hypothetical protein n=1 Tax=Nostoc sp. TaxID=1180 RepID=UPI002FF8D18E
MIEEQLIASLARQEKLLTQLIALMSKSKLGLHDDVGTCKIYCNRRYGCLWYRWDQDQAVAITNTALTGYLKDLRFEKCKRRDKETPKLLITIQADKTYILESGYDTHFSKSLLAAVALLRSDQILLPLTLQPQAGNDESVLFCRVWVGQELVVAPYNDQTNWREIAKRAIAKVKSV